MSQKGSRLKGVARRALGRNQLDQLQQRVEALESEITELRQHNLRLAEISDVIQELLIPLSSRDQDVVDRAIAAYSKSL